MVGTSQQHVVWLSKTGGTDAVFFSRPSDEGNSFSTPLNISNHVGSSAESERMAIDPAENIYIVWSEDSSGTEKLFFERSTDNGGIFSTALPVSNGSVGNDPQIAVDSVGAVNLVWTDNREGYSALFFSRSINEGWTFSQPMKLSGGEPATDPDLDVDAEGNIYLVWAEGDHKERASDIFFSGSTDGGVSFFTPREVSSQESGTVASNPRVAAASPSDINVLWMTHLAAPPLSDTLVYINSNDGGTIFASTFTHVSDGIPETALDSSGGLDLVWQESSSTGNTAIRFGRFVAGVISMGAVIASSSATSAHPRLAIGSNDGALGGITLLNSTDRGATLSDAQTTSIGKSAGPPQLAVDSNGDSYIAWSQPMGTGHSSLSFSRNSKLIALSLNPPSASGNGTSTGTVALSGPAPVGGATISLSSNSPNVHVPGVVTIPEGSNTETFQVRMGTVNEPTLQKIFATWRNVMQTVSLSALPPSSATTFSPANDSGEHDLENMALMAVSAALNQTTNATDHDGTGPNALVPTGTQGRPHREDSNANARTGDSTVVGNFTAVKGQNSINKYMSNNVIYVDCNKYPCNADGIRSAIATASTSGGVVVLPPTGSLAGGSIPEDASAIVLPSNVCLVGAGPFATILKWTVAPVTGAIYLAPGTNGSCVRDLGLSFGTACAGANAIRLGDGGSVAVQYNTFRDISVSYDSISTTGTVALWLEGGSAQVSLNHFENIIIQNAVEVAFLVHAEGNTFSLDASNTGGTGNGQALLQEDGSGDNRFDARIESGSSNGSGDVCFSANYDKTMDLVRLVCDMNNAGTAVQDAADGYDMLDVVAIGSVAPGTYGPHDQYRFASLYGGPSSQMNSSALAASSVTTNEISDSVLSASAMSVCTDGSKNLVTGPSCNHVNGGILTGGSCTTAAGVSQNCKSTVNLFRTETDTNYSVSCTGVGMSGSPYIMGITAKATNSVTVEIGNGPGRRPPASSFNEIDCTVTR